MNELTEILQSYLAGSLSLAGWVEWLARVDWEDPGLTQEERDCLGQFELLSTEISDGIREEREFGEAAAQVVAQHKLRDEFRSLAERWRQETGMHSSVPKIAMHPAYQRIIGMGEKAVPLILQELQNQPDHWFWALNTITGQNPIPPDAAGNIRLMTEAWLEWGKKKGHIP